MSAPGILRDAPWRRNAVQQIAAPLARSPVLRDDPAPAPAPAILPSTASERARLQDAVLRALRVRPWAPVAELAVAANVEEPLAVAVLDKLAELDLIQTKGGRYALKSARPFVRRRRREVALSAQALRMLAIVEREGWHTAYELFKFYQQEAEAEGLPKPSARMSSYSVLETLTRRGLIRKVVHTKIQRWGPKDGPLPPSHMEMNVDAPSMLRQAGRERTLALLNERPWQTIPEIARQVGLTQKAVDNLTRQMRGQGILQRAPLPGAIKPIYAFALPGAPDPTADDRARILKESWAQMPEHYGKARELVLKCVSTRPWLSAKEIADKLAGRTTMGGVNQQLETLRRTREIQRAADGVYRYALADVPVPGRFSGHITKAGGLQVFSLADKLLDHLETRGPTGSTIAEMEPFAARTKHKHATVSHALQKLLEDGRVRKEAARGPGSGGRPAMWFFVSRDGRGDERLVEGMELAATTLRARGWTVQLAFAPPFSPPTDSPTDR